MEETYSLFENTDALLDSGGGVHSFARGGWLVLKYILLKLGYMYC